MNEFVGIEFVSPSEKTRLQLHKILLIEWLLLSLFLKFEKL